MKLFRPGGVFAARYEIRALLGIGPVSATYCAADRDMGGEVALKVFHAHLFPTTSERRSFETTLRKASNLSHPLLRRFLDVDVQGPLVFCTSPYYAAETMRQMLLRGMRYEPYELEPLLWQLTQAIDYLGALPHGGIRPENVLLLTGGCKLTDVGLMLSLPPGSYLNALVKEGAGAYVSLEAREGAPSNRSDVYSLGMLVCEMLLGAPPKGELPKILTRQVGPTMTDVLRRAVAKEAHQRQKNAASFFAQFTEALHAEKIKEPPKKAIEKIIEPPLDQESMGLESVEMSSIPEVSRIETVIREPETPEMLPRVRIQPEEDEQTSIRLMGPFEELPVDESKNGKPPTEGLFEKSKPVEHPSDKRGVGPEKS
jgi:serine/threonine protein kinase